MPEPEPQPYKELIQGPGSLDEFLIEQGQYLNSEIQYQSKNSDGSPGIRKGSEAATRKLKDKFNTIDEARAALASGDKTQGLKILHDEIESVKEGIRFNEGNGNYDYAKLQHTVLVAWQLLEADETGKEPKYLGIKKTEEKDAYILPENVKRSDLITANFFKTVHTLERHINMRDAYGMHDTTSGWLGNAFDKLFDYSGGLNESDKNILKKYIMDISDSIKDFRLEHLKVRFNTSSISTPQKDAKPQEIVRLHDPYNAGFTPNAVIFMENGGELKARYAIGQNLIKKVEDIDGGADGINVAEVGKIKPLPEDLEEKIAKELQSEEFQKQWNKLYPEHKLNPLFV